MQAAMRIRDMDKNVIIIFITNSAQFAVQGYKVEALDLSLIHILCLRTSTMSDIFSGSDFLVPTKVSGLS